MKIRAKGWLLVGGASLAAAGALFVLRIMAHGVSARDQPTALETVLARAMRHLAIPGGDRAKTNPVAATPAVLDHARAHFADHCALCHANDGSGQTEIGQGLYPKPPDMRLDATQKLLDGELFAIIANGVRLTGMPAWGDGSAQSDKETWELVQFIRRLPSLTPPEIEAMRGLNPKTREEWKREDDERRFLAGQDVEVQHAH
jgi:mono/diheme cytochrome c family protein